jgi:branched-chain amino acid transport system permease protein
MIARLVILAVGALVAAAPVLVEPYYLTLMVPAFGYGIALLGMNLLLGYTGLLTFGHALFLALGAYSAAYLTSKFGILYFELILITAGAVALVVAIPVGLLCVRYIKIFFGILTLAFSMLFYSFLFKFYHLTGGDEGMRVLRPLLFGFDTSSMDKITYLTRPYYYYVFGLLLVATLLMHRISRSPFGLRLRAIRDNPQKAEYLGVRVRLYRFAAFLISAVFGAVGGAVISIPTGLADPGLAYWVQSGNLVFMLLLGGYTNFFGPLIGAMSFTLLQDQIMSVTEYWRFFFGVILALIVIFAPHGIMGVLDRRGRWSV